MTIRYITDVSSILDSPANLLICPVNCVPGVLGAGLAKAFAVRWPGLKIAHARAVRFGMISPGRGHLVSIVTEPDRPDPFGIYLLATKDDWRDPSRIEWIESGLQELGSRIDPMSWEGREHPIRSVAMPAIGTGLGGLAWSSVHPLIVRLADSLPAVAWVIYPPSNGFR